MDRKADELIERIKASGGLTLTVTGPEDFKHFIHLTETAMSMDIETLDRALFAELAGLRGAILNRMCLARSSEQDKCVQDQNPAPHYVQR